jgi:hypothetical protein
MARSPRDKRAKPSANARTDKYQKVPEQAQQLSSPMKRNTFTSTKKNREQKQWRPNGKQVQT